MARADLESLFLQHLPAAEKILAALARRHALSPDAAEEFAAWAKLQIIENDYAVLAKFRGESSVPTYLTVVFSMLLREYRVQQWGRWRPSAAAKRNGGVAVKLETLMHRDGLSLSQAGEILRTSGDTTFSDRELGAIASRFPMRSPLRPVEFGTSPADAASDTRADEIVRGEETAARADTAQRALAQALDALPSEDRLIVRLHYMEDVSVADIARGLALPQKPLYRRLERALSTIRTGLERAGVSRDHVRELVADPP
jgi:RNA polymerase sigma factor (sigma-70 family)